MICHQLTKYVGAYSAAMGGVDAIVFTGGIGENNTSYRERVAANLGFMGVEMDPAKNAVAKLGAEMDVATESSKVRILIIPTNEELMIAKDTFELCK
jgi:acetate kinase